MLTCKIVCAGFYRSTVEKIAKPIKTYETHSKQPNMLQVALVFCSSPYLRCFKTYVSALRVAFRNSKRVFRVLRFARSFCVSGSAFCTFRFSERVLLFAFRAARFVCCISSSEFRFLHFSQRVSFFAFRATRFVFCISLMLGYVCMYVCREREEVRVHM